MIARPHALRDSSAIHDLRARQVALLLGCRAKWEKTGGEPIHLRAHEPIGSRVAEEYGSRGGGVAGECVRQRGRRTNDATLIAEKHAPVKGKSSRHQNGLTITMMTMSTIRTVGTSFHIRQWRADTVLRSSANMRTEREKNP